MKSWIERAADDRGVSRSRAWAAIVVPIVGLVVLGVVRVFNIAAFRFLLEEDGLVEWLQFVCFLAAAVLALVIAVRCWANQRRLIAIAYAVAAAGLLFVSGEEIAWGSRLLALETPEWLEEINLQEEVTLHNIDGVLLWFNVVLLVTSVYGIVADPLNWRTSFADRWFHGRALFVPPFFLVTAFGVMAVLRTYRLLVGGPAQYTITKFIEWAELCYAAALLWFVWLALRELRAGQERGMRRGGAGESPHAHASLRTQDP